MTNHKGIISVVEAAGISQSEVQRIGEEIVGVIKENSRPVEGSGDVYEIDFPKVAHLISDLMIKDEAMRRLTAVNMVQMLMYQLQVMSAEASLQKGIMTDEDTEELGNLVDDGEDE